MSGAGPAVDLHAYCREVEAYLCRRNGGHLIRVVGPSFDLVKGWAEQGIPLSVVCDAIDRTVDRAERKPGRRRPLRIEFCEADVLDGFDRWRRAVGVVAQDAASARPARGGLTGHVDRVSVQLAALLGSDRTMPSVRQHLPGVLAALDAVKAACGTARGTAREEILASLDRLDRTLVDAADAALAPDRRAGLQADAVRELEGYRGRLDAAQWASAVEAARVRLVRAEAGLPVVRFE